MSVRKHNSNMHKGHRQRVYKKYRELGFDHFAIHEILEMCLFFIVPQRDTNPLSHNLLYKFGSFYKVFDADYSELVDFGLTENIASYLKYLPEISDFYMSDRLNVRQQFIFPEQLRNFLKNKYMRDNTITTYIVLTDIDNRVLFTGVLAKGEPTIENFPIKRLIELCIIYNAQGVVISHNYPENVPAPHKVDEKLSKFIRNALADIFVPVNQHFISVYDEDAIVKGYADFENNVKIIKEFLTFLTRNKDIDKLCETLIETFGSVSGVFEANFSALKDCGATDTVANYIKFLPDFTRIYLEDKRKDRFNFVHPDTLCSFFRYKYIGRTKEVLYTLLLDEKYRVLYCDIVSRGSLSNAEVPVKNIVELCIDYKAKYAVVSHNHPHTNSTPSDDDINATCSIRDALKNMNVELIDHIIVSATDETAIGSKNLKRVIKLR